jgi:hypothetical protein
MSSSPAWACRPQLPSGRSGSDTRVPDERLGAGLAAFTQRFPRAHDLRDVLTHFDEYVLDEGRLHRKGKVELAGLSSARTRRGAYRGGSRIQRRPPEEPESVAEMGPGCRPWRKSAADTTQARLRPPSSAEQSRYVGIAPAGAGGPPRLPAAGADDGPHGRVGGLGR